MLAPAADPDLVPFDPPEHPSWRATFRNVIETYPRALYGERGMMRYRNRLWDTALVTAPELIHDILVARVDSFRRDDVAREVLTPALGATALFMAEGAQWRWQRRAAAPAFRPDRLAAFVPTFAAMAARQVERWQTAPRDAPVDAAEAMSRTTFEIILETMLGGAGALDANEFARALATELRFVPWPLILAALGLPSWLPYPGRLRAARARQHIHRETARLVAEHRQTPSQRADLIDLLVQARDEETGRHMSDDELVHNIATFIIAGHETTAVALTWTLWLLAKYPAVQDAVAAEAFAVAGSGAIEAAQVERLALTRQVLQEAMRLYPPAPAVSRQPLAPLTLGGEELTPKTQVIVPIYVLHRNDRLWDNPLIFDPGRFTPERSKARSRYAYLPFGAGPRVCIGGGFAMLEATVILATLVRAFRFRPVAGHRPHPLARVTLRPRGGMPLYVEKR
jgi:cytochrome P450